MDELSYNQPETLSSRIHRIESPVEWPPKHVTSYLIEADEPVLIDGGVPHEEGRQSLEEGLAERGYSVSDIEHLVVTHPHVDHLGQVSTVVDEADPTVYTYVETPEMLEVDTSSLRDKIREVGFSGDLVETIAQEREQKAEVCNACFPPEAADVLVDHGDSFEAGGTVFDVLYTPGHEAHHISLETNIGGERVMFSGDVMIRDFRSRSYHAGFGEGMYDGIEAYYESYEKLRGRDVDRVYPGHGPSFECYDAVVEQGLDSLDEAVEDVYDNLDAIGRSTAFEVIYSRVDGEADKMRHIVFDTVGALGYLEKHGKVESEMDDDGMRRFVTVE